MFSNRKKVRDACVKQEMPDKSNPTNLRNSITSSVGWKILIGTLSACGHGANAMSKENTVSLCWLIFGSLFIFTEIIFRITSVFLSSSMWFVHFPWLLRDAIVLISNYYLRQKRIAFEKVITNASNSTFLNLGRVKLKMFNMLLFAWFYYLLLSIIHDIQIFTFDETKMKHELEEVFSYNFDNFSSLGMHFLFYFERIMYCLCGFLPLVFIPTTYICFVVLLNQEISDFIQQLKVSANFERSPIAANILDLKRKYIRFLSNIENVNDAFSNIVFLWCAANVCGTCFEITRLIMAADRIGVDKEFTVRKFSIAALWWVIFLGITLAASTMEDNLNSFLMNFQAVSEKVCIIDKEAQRQVESVFLRVKVLPWRYTAGGCFAINKGFIVTVIGVVISYVVIIIQVNPQVSSMLNKLEANISHS